MNEFKLKTYIADKANDIFEKFIYKTCQQVYRRRISENDYHWSVIWNDACYHKIGFRFMDESIPQQGNDLRIRWIINKHELFCVGISERTR